MYSFLCIRAGLQEQIENATTSIESGKDAKVQHKLRYVHENDEEKKKHFQVFKK